MNILAKHDQIETQLHHKNSLKVHINLIKYVTVTNVYQTILVPLYKSKTIHLSKIKINFKLNI